MSNSGEQAGRRPALVLSDRQYNERSELMVLCPITSQYKPYPFVVALPEALLSKPSYVLSDQVKSLDWKKRNVTFIKEAPDKVLAEVTVFACGIVAGKK